MDVVGSITGFFREILWGLIYLLLWVTDTLWKVVMKIATLNFFEKGNVAKWYSAIAGVLILFVVFRIIKIMIKFFTSEDYRVKLDPIHMMLMIGVASFTIAFTPIAYQYINDIAISSIRQMSNFTPQGVGIKSDGTMDARISDVLVQASSISLDGKDNSETVNQQIASTKKDIARYEKEIKQAEAEKKKAEVGSATWNGANQTIQNNKENLKTAKATLKNLQQRQKGVSIYDNDDFDVNAKDDDGNYMFFPSWASMFFMLGIAFMGLRTFTGVAFSIGKRSILICIQYLMAPYAIASLVDSESKDFKTWAGLIGGNFIMNFAQVYGCYFILYMINGNLLQSALGNDFVGLLARIVILIAGFMAIENIPSYIGRIMGGSSATVSQSISEAKGIGGSAGGAASFGAGALLGTAGTAAAVVGGAVTGFRESDGEGAGSRILSAAGGAVGGAAGSASMAGQGMRGRRSAAATGAGILAAGGRSIKNAASGLAGQAAGMAGQTATAAQGKTNGPAGSKGMMSQASRMAGAAAGGFNAAMAPFNGRGQSAQDMEQSEGPAGRGIFGGMNSDIDADSDDISDVQRAEAMDAGMDVDGMSKEEFNGSSQAFSLPQYPPETPAEEKTKVEDTNPNCSPAQAMYRNQASERLSKRRSQQQSVGRIIDTDIKESRKENK